MHQSLFSANNTRLCYDLNLHTMSLLLQPKPSHAPFGPEDDAAADGWLIVSHTHVTSGPSEQLYIHCLLRGLIPRYGHKQLYRALQGV